MGKLPPRRKPKRSEKKTLTDRSRQVFANVRALRKSIGEEKYKILVRSAGSELMVQEVIEAVGQRNDGLKFLHTQIVVHGPENVGKEINQYGAKGFVNLTFERIDQALEFAFSKMAELGLKFDFVPSVKKEFQRFRRKLKIKKKRKK